MGTAVPSINELVGKYGSGADTYAGTVNAVSALNGGTTQDKYDAAFNLLKTRPTP
ncbi:MAG: hypothetical protein H0X13_04685 [Ramlibacter sp.]|nr:hypothetical protein [Ramlibacter sp.]